MRQICKQCSAPFEITDDDLAFYEAVSPVFNGKKELIPPPTLCPDCRWQRRMLWRREHALKHRECNLCGKSIVSIHAADAPYPVYCVKCFWSDGWDARSYGREVDLHRPFGEQFAELRHRLAELPGYPAGDAVKVPLAYLLDRALGLKGYAKGPVRLFERQPLVIVARTGAQAKDVEELASEVERRVQKEFGITLEREVETFE